jgi:NADH-quinone oxidoreductase subunit J
MGDIFLLTIMAAAALWSAMTRSLIRSAIALALTSALLAIVLYRLGSPLAGVFELSVCSGLISVLFISAISMSEAMSWAQIIQHMKQRRARFAYLPVLVLVIGLMVSLLKVPLGLRLPLPEIQKDPGMVIWSLRQLDLLGQVIIFLVGALGVVVLFKER